MSDEPQPQTAIGATGKVASDIVGGLKGQPMLLGIVVLNVIGIAAALYFLNKIADQADSRYQLLLRYCLEVSDDGRP